MVKKNIICIMGKSGSGKSTIINKICEINNEFYGVKSYTTRNIRPDENDETTHVFVDDEFYDLHKDRAIAMYHSNYNYHSWTDDNSFKNDCTNLYAIDSKEFVNFSDKYKDVYNIYGIYLKVDEEERKKRLDSRNDHDYYSLEEHLSEKYLYDAKDLNNYIVIDITKNNVEDTVKLILGKIKKRV